jgi:predicted nucleic acid-binding protein
MSSCSAFAGGGWCAPAFGAAMKRPSRRSGPDTMPPHPRHPIDKQIAAIALIHDLTVVTRNVEDFPAAGVRVKNPLD